MASISADVILCPQLVVSVNYRSNPMLTEVKRNALYQVYIPECSCRQKKLLSLPSFAPATNCKCNFVSSKIRSQIEIFLEIGPSICWPNKHDYHNILQKAEEIPLFKMTDPKFVSLGTLAHCATTCFPHVHGM